LLEQAKGLVTRLVDFAFDIAFQQQPRLSFSASSFDRQYKVNTNILTLCTFSQTIDFCYSLYLAAH